MDFRRVYFNHIGLIAFIAVFSFAQQAHAVTVEPSPLMGTKPQSCSEFNIEIVEPISKSTLAGVRKAIKRKKNWEEVLIQVRKP